MSLIRGTGRAGKKKMALIRGTGRATSRVTKTATARSIGGLKTTGLDDCAATGRAKATARPIGRPKTTGLDDGKNID